jgi:hypothetical protein
MTRRAVLPPSGGELIEELRAAAAALGVSLKTFVAPLVTSTASNFISCLSRSRTPMALTIARVRACCAGEPLPDARPSEWGEPRGVKHMQVTDSEARIPGAEIDRRRMLAERAHAERRPGESLAAAVRRLTEGESE